MLLLNLHGGGGRKSISTTVFSKIFLWLRSFLLQSSICRQPCLLVKVKGSIVGILASCFLCCGISKRNTDANESQLSVKVHHLDWTDFQSKSNIGLYLGQLPSKTCTHGFWKIEGILHVRIFFSVFQFMMQKQILVILKEF